MKSEYFGGTLHIFYKGNRVTIKGTGVILLDVILYWNLLDKMIHNMGERKYFLKLKQELDKYVSNYDEYQVIGISDRFELIRPLKEQAVMTCETKLFHTYKHEEFEKEWFWVNTEFSAIIKDDKYMIEQSINIVLSLFQMISYFADEDETRLLIDTTKASLNLYSQYFEENEQFKMEDLTFFPNLVYHKVRETMEELGSMGKE